MFRHTLRVPVGTLEGTFSHSAEEVKRRNTKPPGLDHGGLSCHPFEREEKGGKGMFAQIGTGVKTP